MHDLTVTHGVVTNYAEIVELAEHHRSLFEDYPSAESVAGRPTDRDPFDPGRDSEYEDDDQYHVLQGNRMPDDLRAAVLAGILPAGAVPTQLYVQVNRYDAGDFILPHRDTLQQGLYMLTDSPHDALVAQDAQGNAVRVPDRAGTYITHDPSAWHWVDPVRCGPRYTIVTIPALPGGHEA